jgi:hypothetical protein
VTDIYRTKKDKLSNINFAAIEGSDIMESEVQNVIKKSVRKRKKRKKIVRGIILCFSTLLLIYLGVSAYFMKHFYSGSEINSIKVSGKTVEEVKKLMSAELQKYTLTLKGRDGKIEQIKPEDIGLKYNLEGKIENFKGTQNPFNWISTFFSSEGYKTTVDTSYDDKLLKEKIDKLSYFKSSNIIAPKNASLENKGTSYVIIDEVMGNKVKRDILYSRIKAALVSNETSLDLEAADCYENPEYTSKSKKITEARDTINKYLSTKITYDFGDREEILEATTINKWLTVDKDYKISIAEKKIREYIYELSKIYNTLGKIRNFVTSSGNTIAVGGGDYGWAISITNEAKQIISAIKEGKAVTKRPAYYQTALSRNTNDIGNTYLEVDMTKQHIWFYKNGVLIAQGDVVTGKLSKNDTPRGIYSLKYKQRNAILKGEDYESPVNFWMPFTGNVGLHDASWRTKFGGEIYKTNGSHGCVNAPYNLAQTVFKNIEAGTPVVCYY